MITDEDRKYYYKNNEFDEEAWNDLAARGFAGTENKTRACLKGFFVSCESQFVEILSE